MGRTLLSDAVDLDFDFYFAVQALEVEPEPAMFNNLQSEINNLKSHVAFLPIADAD